MSSDWENAFENHVTFYGHGKPYLFARYYAELARAINSRRAYIGQPLTNFTWLGANPSDEVLVGLDTGEGDPVSGGCLWPRDMIAVILQEFIDSVQDCCTSCGSQDGKTWYWVESGPTLYGTTKRTNVEGDPWTITDWRKIIGCCWAIVDNLTTKWAMPRLNMGRAAGGFVYSQTRPGVTESFTWQYSGWSIWLYPAWQGAEAFKYATNAGYGDWNNTWEAFRGQRAIIIYNAWGNMEVPLRLKLTFGTRSSHWQASAGVSWDFSCVQIDQAEYMAFWGTTSFPYSWSNATPLVSDNTEGVDWAHTYWVTLTTPPGQNIYLAEKADIMPSGNWAYTRTGPNDPKRAVGAEGGLGGIYMYDENMNFLGYG